MANRIEQARAAVDACIREAYLRAAAAGDLPEGADVRGSVEQPKDTANGDFAANHAMASAKTMHMAPRKIAEALIAHMELDGTWFASVEAAGPGFLNFRLSDKWYQDVLTAVDEAGADYGRVDDGHGEKVMVEFVSANPTGPMTIGNARGGVLGDALASVLDRAGYNVWREFYVNDAGNQVDLFGKSIEARYLQLIQGEDAVEFPDNGYHGDDIRELAKLIYERDGDKYLTMPSAERCAAFVAFGLPYNIARMQRDLERYRIHFDQWFLESSLHSSGYVAQTVQLLVDAGLTYEKDGALWLKTSEILAANLRKAGKSEEAIEKDIALMTFYGAEVKLNTPAPSVSELKAMGYTHIFFAVGAGKAGQLDIPGNVVPVIQWLRDLKAGKEVSLGHVAVVGGGNTAMDAARAALRAGAKTSTLVYRRTKKYMPADAEELELAVEDGVRFLELVAPVEQANGKLKCEVMKLGDPDEKGRRSPVPTGEFTEIDCDTVIAAVGERVDSDLFTANGIEVNTKGIPEFRTNLENVFVGGDAMRGPATVVEGIADAQYFANAVIGSVHSVAIPDDAHATRDEAIARKGVLCPPKAGCEGERCLHCNTVCQVCADVCPNRANVVITLPDSRHEILHVDRMCNECGNCAVFCPYDSAPYRNKFTLFLTRDGFDESTENQGFLPLEGRKVLVRLDGKVFEADLDGQNQLPADVETFILTVLKDYAYLL